MALTIAHPGVIRQHNALWLASPNVGDVSKLKRRPRRTTPRGFYHQRFIDTMVALAIFVPALLLNAYVPPSAKQIIAGWVPAVDTTAGFTVLVSIIAIVILGVYFWRTIQTPDVETLATLKQAIPLDHFANVNAKVTNRMPWDKLWDLGSALAHLEEASNAAIDARLRHNSSAAERNRREARERYYEVQKAAAALDIKVDLSVYSDASENPSAERP